MSIYDWLTSWIYLHDQYHFWNPKSSSIHRVSSSNSCDDLIDVGSTQSRRNEYVLRHSFVFPLDCWIVSNHVTVSTMKQEGSWVYACRSFFELFTCFSSIVPSWTSYSNDSWRFNDNLLVNLLLGKANLVTKTSFSDGMKFVANFEVTKFSDGIFSLVVTFKLYMKLF